MHAGSIRSSPVCSLSRVKRPLSPVNLEQKSCTRRRTDFQSTAAASFLPICLVRTYFSNHPSSFMKQLYVRSTSLSQTVSSFRSRIDVLPTPWSILLAHLNASNWTGSLSFRPRFLADVRYLVDRPNFALTHREIGPSEGFAYFMYLLTFVP